MNPLYLASRSPRRSALLAEAGIPFNLLDVDVSEQVIDKPRPRGLALRLAMRKAIAGAERVEDGLVLGADTIVALGDRVFGKPENRDHGRRMLKELSGHQHEVITGVAIVDARTHRSWSGIASTAVHMRTMSDEEIETYVRSGEGDGKAGSYAIQESADVFVEKLVGPYDNVVGLPVDLVRLLLKQAVGS